MDIKARFCRVVCRRDFLFRGLAALASVHLAGGLQTARAGILKCSECGAPLESGDRFCTRCGHKRGDAPASPSSVATVDDNLERSVFSLRMSTDKVPFIPTRTVHGNGFAISSDTIVTDILFGEDPGSLEVRTVSGERLRTRSLYSDPWVGLLFLGVEGAQLRPLDIGSEADPRFGQQVHVSCIPHLGGTAASLNYVAGVVSGMHRFGVGFRQLEDYIQIDTVVPEGALGAPVLDTSGRVIGVYSGYRYVPMGYRTHRVSGINYALPVGQVRRAMTAVQGETPVTWSWIGLLLGSDRSSGGKKLEVRYVYPGILDFKPGDELLLVGAREVASTAFPVLQREVSQRPPGSILTVEVRRNGERLLLKSELQRRPSWPRLAPLDAIHWLLGVRIRGPNGAEWPIDEVAEWQRVRGVLPTDRVRLLNGEKIRDKDHLATLTNDAYGDHSLSLSLTLRSRGAGRHQPVLRSRAYYRVSNPITL